MAKNLVVSLWVCLTVLHALSAVGTKLLSEQYSKKVPRFVVAVAWLTLGLTTVSLFTPSVVPAWGGVLALLAAAGAVYAAIQAFQSEAHWPAASISTVASAGVVATVVLKAVA